MKDASKDVIETLKSLNSKEVEKEILDYLIRGFNIEDIDAYIVKPAFSKNWERNAWRITRDPINTEEVGKEALFNKLQKYTLKDLGYRIGIVFPEEIQE